MRLVLALALAVVAGCAPDPPPPAPVVLAASSLQEALTTAAGEWEKQGHPRPTLSFAASSALARQVESGAQADIFISADEQWMDHVEASGALRAGTRFDLVGNALVLAAPRDSAPVALAPTALAKALGDGRLAMADPDAVPAGRYGREALESLGLWPAVAARITRSENVRAALALVERGEAPLGIVYATDVQAAPALRAVAVFPKGSHAAIRYPAALLAAGRHADAAAFLTFLGSPDGQRIFRGHGFTPPDRR
jgi:molybdate transport system substrate-binding protein